MLKKFLKHLNHPTDFLLYLSIFGLYDFLSDETYLKFMYRIRMGKKLNLKNPQTFNEKLQWLKLYGRKPEYTIMADKYAVRKYIADTIGEEYLIPLLGVWDNPDDIDFDKLPDQFVLKCNHNSGLGMCICKDKSKLDINKVKKELKKGLEQDYYLTAREWPYKNVPRKIIAEKYMEEKPDTGLNDYKFFCFNGIPKLILVCSDRFSNDGLCEDFYDTDWNLLNLRRPDTSNSKQPQKQPQRFGDMLRLAAVISENIPFARVDFYEIKGKIYFGEITFFPASGLKRFTPEEWDLKLGKLIDLSKTAMEK